MNTLLDLIATYKYVILRFASLFTALVILYLITQSAMQQGSTGRVPDIGFYVFALFGIIVLVGLSVYFQQKHTSSKQKQDSQDPTSWLK